MRRGAGENSARVRNSRPTGCRSRKSSRQKKTQAEILAAIIWTRARLTACAWGKGRGAKARHVVRRSLVLARTGDLTLLLPSTQERRGTTLFSSPKYRFRCSVLEYAPVELPLTSLSESFSSLQYYGIIKLYIRWRTADRRRIMACVSRSHICPS